MSKLIGAGQICDYVGFSWPTVSRWIDTNKFPAVQLEGKSTWLSDKTLIDEWWVDVIRGELGRPSGVSRKKIGKKVNNIAKNI